MYDDEGHHTGVSTTTGLVEEDIPGSYFQRFGDVEYVSIPTESVVHAHHEDPSHAGASSSVRVVVSAPASLTSHAYQENSVADDIDSYTIIVQESVDDQPNGSVRYADIPASLNSVATLDIPEDIKQLSYLDIDQNSDGVSDVRVGPDETYVTPTGSESNSSSSGSVEGAISSARRTGNHRSNGANPMQFQDRQELVFDLGSTAVTVIHSNESSSIDFEDPPTKQTAAVFNVHNGIHSLFDYFADTMKVFLHILTNVFNR
jgi:hypothetical protein